MCNDTLEREFVSPLKEVDFIEGYKVLKRLGHGGFGTTYLCVDTYLKRKGVLKEYSPLGLVYRDKAKKIIPKRLAYKARFRFGNKDFLVLAKDDVLGRKLQDAEIKTQRRAPKRTNDE